MVETPEISLVAILPELALTVGAVVVLMVAVSSRRAATYLPWIAGLTVAATGAGLIAQYNDVAANGFSVSYAGMIVLDNQGIVIRTVMLAAIAVALLVGWRYVTGLGTRGGEALSLVFLSAVGFMLMASSIHFMLLFLGLEVGSISLYVLAALGQRAKRADEAAMKYFLLGSVASAIFLYGVALLYAGTGSLTYLGVFEFFSGDTLVFSDGLLSAGVALLFVGLLFKIAAAPFHSWAPDVYQGAPAGIVGYMGAAAKIGAIAALLRFVQVPFQSVIESIQVPLAAVAAFSVVLGTLYAIVQQDLRRVLAYSGVSHAGFLLMGIATGGVAEVQVLFYLATYVLVLVGAFGIVSLLEGSGSAGSPIENWKGLGRRSPFLAWSLTVFMLGMAGMPATAGFIGKFGIFTRAWSGDLEWLVIVGLLASVAAFFFYLRVVVAMFFEDGDGKTPKLGWPAGIGIGLTLVITVGLGLYPTPLLDVLTAALG